MKSIMELISIPISIFVVSVLSAESVRAEDKFAVAGDFGCNMKAISNIDSIAKSKAFFVGLGDYSHECNPETIFTFNAKMQSYDAWWDSINSSKRYGCPGNHEIIMGEGKRWAQEEFHYGSNGYWARLFGHTAVICINNYKSYEPGSTQYNFIVSESENLDRQMAIRSVIEPLAQKYHAVIIAGHWHGTYLGVKNNVPIAICGGGGDNGFTAPGNVKDRNGFTYTNSINMGWCSIRFGDNVMSLWHIDLNGHALFKRTVSKR
jgi:calcineurin-like phosphoesterase family protein